MAQTVPIDVRAGISKTGVAFGATIYQLDGTTSFAAFSATGWYEAPAGSGSFHHAGISFPDAGGVIAYGVSGTEYNRFAIGPSGVNVGSINGNATAAAQLALSAATIVNGAATATTLSTTQMSTNLTNATNDQYKNRVIIWTSGALQNQVASITAYNGTSKTLTFTTVTSAPSNGDTFIIV